MTMTTKAAPITDKLTLPSIRLFFRNGVSDKEYHIAIAEASGGLYVVNFANGRRGGTLTAGAKTQVPVTIEDAIKVYHKLLKEKTAKGYTPDGEGTPFSMTENKGKLSGLIPQLLTPTLEAEQYLTNPDFCLQEKHNGKHVMARVLDGVVTASNKLGLIIPIPQENERNLSALPDCEVDGELVGTRFFLFDLLSLRGHDLRHREYVDRFALLLALVPTFKDVSLCVVETAWSEESKRASYVDLVANNREGVVFKRWNAPSTPGRPASGGNQFKVKFYATASFIVADLNAKRSIKLSLNDSNGGLVSVGNCTIPPNKAVPPIGSIVEIRYLYAHVGGSIVQPTYIEERDDVLAGECGTHQLKCKPEDSDEEDN